MGALGGVAEEQEALDGLADDVVDWVARHARVEPVDPGAGLDILAELAGEIATALRVATTIERERCARLAEQAGYHDLARRLRDVPPPP